MGMLDFFRKKKLSGTEKEVEEISFDDIGKWVEAQSKDLGEDEKRVLVSIGEKLDEFYVSLDEKLEVLKGIDIESRKEHGRAKVLVRQGLDKYINFVHILLKDLGGIKMRGLDGVIREVGEMFGKFERSSAKSYERATYLVGDEMMVVRNEIRGFYNGLVKMFEDDKSSIRDLNRVGNVKVRLNEFEDGKKNSDVVRKEIEVKSRNIGKAKAKVEELNSEIEKIKSGSEYVANVKMGEGIKILRSDIEKEISLLRGLVDFKKIIGIVHGNVREFDLIKNYRDHFASEFSSDEGKRLLDLLESLNMKSSVIRGKFDLIKKMGGELKKKVGEVGLDVTVAKLVEIEKVRDEIDGMKTERVKIERRLEEGELKLKGLRNEVIKLVEEIGGVKVA